MSNQHEFDVAISFAGEQRAEARDIANCLKPDIKVFFDEFEQAKLWGRDLYEHLAEVYHRKARYCLMLVSKTYAEKVWTTHERRNAQARAIQEKEEYILPVRFDDTEVPGLSSTIGYVMFKDYAAEGICNLIRAKLGKARAASVPNPARTSTVRTSPRVMFLESRNNLQAWITATGGSWGEDEATLFLVPDDGGDEAFLNQLRGSRTEFWVVYKHNFAACRPNGVTHIHKEGQDQWKLDLQLQTAELGRGFEVSLQNLSADQIAERRARRILLNQDLATKGNDINDRMMEAFISGSQSGGQMSIPIEESPFPKLYEDFGHDALKFLEIAWITAVMLLKGSGTVAEITDLELTLQATNLQVRFAGKRQKHYSNQPASTIGVTGICNLKMTGRS